jgi:dTDP-4-dehydrorhamnose 3,5-epimerase
MILGKIKYLVPIVDERGRIMEMLRTDDAVFHGFGQSYLCVVNPGAVKAWHRHKHQYDAFVCVKGAVKVVLYQPSEDGWGYTAEEHFLSEHDPKLLSIPPGVWHGMKGISVEPALIVNTCSQAYNHADPDEERQDAHGVIPYDWQRKDG